MDVTEPMFVPTKAQPPRVPPTAIERSLVHDRLEAVLDHPVTLVTAPAGFGKSWALAGWLQADAAAPSCWVSLDPYDDDAIRL